MSLSEQFLHLSQLEYWGLLLICAAAGLAGFYFAFRWLTRARLIEDAPTARIRSAQQGYVELNGIARALSADQLRAPLTATPCCWYRFRIERRGSKHWQLVEGDTSDSLFALQDDTGRCLVDPDGAEVTPASRSVWYGHQRYPKERHPASQRVTPTPLLQLAGLLNTPIGPARYRYTEERIVDGDRLHALGLFRSEDDLDQQQARDDLTRALLREWKQNQPDLLARFDLNNDGQIDSREWQLARQAARRQSELAQPATHPDGPQHRLTAPGTTRQPYLISSLEEFELVRRYRWRAGLALAGFFLGGGASAWLLGLRQLG